MNEIKRRSKKQGANAEALRTLETPTGLPRALYRAQQVVEFDRIAIEKYEIPAAELMERAGQAAFERLQERWPKARRLLILAGVGNNAGDGFVVARLAVAAGMEVTVIQFGNPAQMRGAALQAVKGYLDSDGVVQRYQGELPDRIDLIVDALLGIGLDRAVRDQWAAGIEAANAHAAPIFSLDIPSGLHADTGRVMEVAIRADYTLSFIGLKQGLFTGDGPDCSAEVGFSALELPARIYSQEILSARRMVWSGRNDGLSPRPSNSHKFQFGHVLVVGGDHGYLGAVRLAGEAALRTGAGMVTVATRPEHAGLLAATRPELATIALDDMAPLHTAISRATVLVLGPGLGRSPWAQKALRAALESKLPCVVDADALNLLAMATSAPKRENWILTPHPGEAARLLDCTAATIQSNRFAAARQIADRFGGFCVLKGAGTIVQGDGHRPPGVCAAGNPGMSSAGMGDVLAGVIGALIAQHMGVQEAAEYGVCLHAAAGDIAAAKRGERGLLASDLMSVVQRLVNRR